MGINVHRAGGLLTGTYMMGLMKQLGKSEDSLGENKSKKNSIVINKMYMIILIFIGLTF